MIHSATLSSDPCNKAMIHDAVLSSDPQRDAKQ